MICDDIQARIPLFLYGELSFDAEEEIESHLLLCRECQAALERERRLHQALSIEQCAVSLQSLRQSRQELQGRLELESRSGRSWLGLVQDLFSVRMNAAPLQPVAGLALLALGFFGAKMLPDAPGGNSVQVAALAAPQTVRIRNLEQQSAGQVRIVVEETRERTLIGRVSDQQIRGLLLTAAKDPDDAGLRVESVDLLRMQPRETEVRSALLSVIQHDPNAGVRLKALDGLKASASEPEVRQALTRVLLNDDNPGVRIQVIDLLTEQTERRMLAGVLQELLTKENNGYVRMRCQKALQEMHASLASF